MHFIVSTDRLMLVNVLLNAFRFALRVSLAFYKLILAVLIMRHSVLIAKYFITS